VATVAAWVRFSVRRQGRSLALLALLVALSGATVLGAVAGARRGSSAVARLQAATLPATAVVLPNEPGFDWDAVADLPEVVAVAPFVVSYMWSIDGVDRGSYGFPFTTADILTTIERPVILQGRNLDVTRADEVLVTRQFVRATGLTVGDTVRITLPTPEENATTTPDPPSAERPELAATIVGVGESPWFSDLPGQEGGGIMLSPGVAAAYPDNLIGRQAPGDLNYLNALVRLAGGEADLPALERDLARLTGRSDIEIWNLGEQARVVQRHVDFESRWLLAFGAAALVASLFLVGQAAVRLAASDAADLQIARALGMAAHQATVAGALGTVLAGVAGAPLATLGAVVASRWTPIGTAGYVEPDPGTAADWTVMAIGGSAIVLLVALGALWSTRRALVATGGHPRRRGSLIAARIGRSGLGTPIEVGARLALEPGRGRSAVPVAPALVGAVFGVLGVVAASSFSSGVDDAAGNPERFGQVADADLFLGVNDASLAGDDVTPLIDAIARSPDVASVVDTRTSVATIGDEGDTVSLWEYHPPPQGMRAIGIAGRLPETRDEIALGPATLDAVGASVGDSITLTGTRGRRQFTVTGTAFLVQGPHNGYAEGGWVTSDGFDRVDEGFTYRLALVDLQPGVDAGEAIARVDAELSAVDPTFDGALETIDPPEEIALLAQVRRLPLALAVFLAVLAIAAVGHSLTTAVRRRAGDLAMLRALGMTRRQTRLVVATQATVLALVGLIFGVPLGLLVGMRVWRAIAELTPLFYVTPWAAWVLALVGPVALLTANLLAAWPARRAARMAVAHTLRRE
jgi:ABC-type lipoprotein release transport system permease subunit